MKTTVFCHYIVKAKNLNSELNLKIDKEIRQNLKETTDSPIGKRVCKVYSVNNFVSGPCIYIVYYTIKLVHGESDNLIQISDHEHFSGKNLFFPNVI